MKEGIRLVSKVEITYHEEHDRCIYVKWENEELTSINYMQGDEFELFRKGHVKADEELTKFYHTVRHHMKGNDFYDIMNHVIWLYFELEDAQMLRSINRGATDMLLANTLEALEELMEAEGGEPGESEAHQHAWKKAQDVIKEARG